MQNHAAILEDSLVLSSKTKYTSNKPTGTHIPWYLPKELKTYAREKTYMQIFTAALFIITQTWKMSFSIEWVNKLW